MSTMLCRPQKTDKILHFGADYCAISFFKRGTKISDGDTMFWQWLQGAFENWNDTNSNMRYDESFVYFSEQKFDILSTTLKNGRALQFLYEGSPLFCITENEQKKSNLSPYFYRIDFYSQFFNFERLKKFRSSFFLKYFFALLPFDHSFVRVDLCSDVTMDINSVVGGHYSSRNISISKLNEKDGVPETVYIGSQKTNKKNICIYNKQRDSEQKGKKKFFLDYFDYRVVTRIELRLKSEYIKKFQVNKSSFLNLDFLFFVYSSALNDRFSGFTFLDLFKDWGFYHHDLDCVNTHELMKKDKYVKRFFNMADKLLDTYGTDPVKLLCLHFNI